ncbi:MAG: hypothetical protein EOO67_01265 [Microbacterium sp.]|nr:MAG: hypothetical protein EOO67_01265 [Microbacterium sp.]
MCAAGGACSSFEPGHAVHLIQARLVSATPSEWVDALVETVDADGTLVIRRISDDAAVFLWNGAGAAEALTPGAPVAYHPRYHALNGAGRLFNAAEISDPAVVA